MVCTAFDIVSRTCRTLGLDHFLKTLDDRQRPLPFPILPRLTRWNPIWRRWSWFSNHPCWLYRLGHRSARVVRQGQWLLLCRRTFQQRGLGVDQMSNVAFVVVVILSDPPTPTYKTLLEDTRKLLEAAMKILEATRSYKKVTKNYKKCLKRTTICIKGSFLSRRT